MCEWVNEACCDTNHPSPVPDAKDVQQHIVFYVTCFCLETINNVFYLFCIHRPKRVKANAWMLFPVKNVFSSHCNQVLAQKEAVSVL